MARRKKFPYWMALGLFILIGIASWSLYNILNQGASDVLLQMGIENFYYQNLILVGGVLLLLVVLGHSIKKSVNKIIR